jgi:hypothetical protein
VWVHHRALRLQQGPHHQQKEKVQEQSQEVLLVVLLQKQEALQLVEAGVRTKTAALHQGSSVRLLQLLLVRSQQPRGLVLQAPPHVALQVHQFRAHPQQQTQSHSRSPAPKQVGREG